MKCCKCGKKENPIILLGGFKKFPHCKECNNIINKTNERIKNVRISRKIYNSKSYD